MNNEKAKMLCVCPMVVTKARTDCARTQNSDVKSVRTLALYVLALKLRCSL